MTYYRGVIHPLFSTMLLLLGGSIACLVQNGHFAPLNWFSMAGRPPNLYRQERKPDRRNLAPGRLIGGGIGDCLWFKEVIVQSVYNHILVEQKEKQFYHVLHNLETLCFCVKTFESVNNDIRNALLSNIKD